MQSLRSSSITEPSTLLRTAPPLCPASVLWSSQFQPLGLLPSHRDDRFSRSIQEPDPASRRLYAGCRSGSLQDYSRTRPGSSTRPRFRHHPWHFDTSSAVRSRSPLRTVPRDQVPPFAATLTTIALDDSSLQWFDACA